MTHQANPIAQTLRTTIIKICLSPEINHSFFSNDYDLKSRMP
jgi:hypothetical protein